MVDASTPLENAVQQPGMPQQGAPIPAPQPATPQSSAPDTTQQMSPQEQMGFHKGSFQTLMNERNELYKMIQNVELIAQAHLQALQKLGVSLESLGIQVQQDASGSQPQQNK